MQARRYAPFAVLILAQLVVVGLAPSKPPLQSAGAYANGGFTSGAPAPATPGGVAGPGTVAGGAGWDDRGSARGDRRKRQRRDGSGLAGVSRVLRRHDHLGCRSGCAGQGRHQPLQERSAVRRNAHPAAVRGEVDQRHQQRGGHLPGGLGQDHQDRLLQGEGQPGRQGAAAVAGPLQRPGGPAALPAGCGDVPQQALRALRPQARAEPSTAARARQRRRTPPASVPTPRTSSPRRSRSPSSTTTTPTPRRSSTSSRSSVSSTSAAGTSRTRSAPRTGPTTTTSTWAATSRPS